MVETPPASDYGWPNLANPWWSKCRPLGGWWRKGLATSCWKRVTKWCPLLHHTREEGATHVVVRFGHLCGDWQLDHHGVAKSSSTWWPDLSIHGDTCHYLSNFFFNIVIYIWFFLIRKIFQHVATLEIYGGQPRSLPMVLLSGKQGCHYVKHRASMELAPSCPW